MSARGPRYEAMLDGKPSYWTGSPCKNGHISFRMTSTGTCLECRKERDRAHYAKNTKKCVQKSQSYYQKNADGMRQKRRERYASNPAQEKDEARVRSAIWREKNPDKVKAHSKIKLDYKRRNPHKNAVLLAKRRAAKKQRTPHWLNDSQLWMIEQAYEVASMRSKSTGIFWHVDHIFPLQGKTVSGLHVPWNLQVIPSAENIAKGNKVPADVVAALGNGSTKAGSDKLYEMMHEIRRRYRSAKPKDLPPPAKSPLEYLSKKGRR